MSDKGKQEQPPMAVLNGTITPSGGRPLRTARGIIVVLSLIVVALAVLLLRPVKLDVYKTTREVRFADPALARCVDEVTASNGWHDVGQIVSLRCNNPASEPIRDVGGIEHLVALTDLNLAFNAIDNVEPIAQLPRLKDIELSHNRLSQLPAFRAAATLRRIDVNYNQFETLGWLATQHLASLQSLSVAHNHVRSIADVAAVKTLKELNVRSNHLRSLEPVSALDSLEMLDAGGNRITTLSDVHLPATLRRLFLDHNGLLATDGLEHLQALEELDVGGNDFDHVAHLGQLQRLQRLDLSNTRINSLEPILSLGDIEVLRLQGDVALTCDDIALAMEEFGEMAVRYDQSCPSLTSQ